MRDHMAGHFAATIVLTISTAQKLYSTPRNKKGLSETFFISITRNDERYYG